MAGTQRLGILKRRYRSPGEHPSQYCTAVARDADRGMVRIAITDMNEQNIMQRLKAGVRRFQAVGHAERAGDEIGAGDAPIAGDGRREFTSDNNGDRVAAEGL